jgi:hypothetical protein
VKNRQVFTFVSVFLLSGLLGLLIGGIILEATHGTGAGLIGGNPAPAGAPASGTQYLDIQIWSQTVTTDQSVATFHNSEKLAEFKSDGTWDEVTDLTVEEKQIIAERLKVMLNNWIFGQGLQAERK